MMLTLERRKNISKAMKGIVFSKEHRENLSKSRKGKPLSDIQYKAVCKVNAEKIGTTWKMSKAGRKKISKARKGIKFSSEHKRKLAKAKRGKYGPLSNRWTKDRNVAGIRNRYNKNFTYIQRMEILKQHNYRCAWCGARPEINIKNGGVYLNGVWLEIDHIVPVAAGGERNIKNGQPLCGGRCHKLKRKQDYKLIKAYRKSQQEEHSNFI